jgi:hypothetical protein
MPCGPAGRPAKNPPPCADRGNANGRKLACDCYWTRRTASDTNYLYCGESNERLAVDAAAATCSLNSKTAWLTSNKTREFSMYMRCSGISPSYVTENTTCNRHAPTKRVNWHNRFATRPQVDRCLFCGAHTTGSIVRNLHGRIFGVPQDKCDLSHK